MAFVDFYHYTSCRGKEGILSSGVINKTSNPEHMWYGEGTYGTSMPPSCGKSNIAENTWSGCGDERKARGYLDWAFRLKLPADKVTHYGGHRDILKHKGPINLYECIEWQVIRVNKP